MAADGAPLAGMVIAILTVSRATLGLAGIGYAAVFLLSAVRRWTARKGAVALLGALAIAAASPLVFSSFQQRFSSAPLSDEYAEREAFHRAAEMILLDHPMGIGANNYVMVANLRGYSDRAGVAATAGSRMPTFTTSIGSPPRRLGTLVSLPSLSY